MHSLTTDNKNNMSISCVNEIIFSSLVLSCLPLRCASFSLFLRVLITNTTIENKLNKQFLLN